MRAREIILVRSMGSSAHARRFRAVESYGSHRRSVYVTIPTDEPGKKELNRLQRAWSSASSPLRAALRPTFRSGDHTALVLDHPGGVPLSKLLQAWGALPMGIALGFTADVLRGSAGLGKSPSGDAPQDHVDLGLAHLRDNGQLVLVGMVCDGPTAGELLLSELLGIPTSELEGTLRSSSSLGEDDALEILASLRAPSGDPEAQGARLRAMALRIDGPDRGDFATEAVPLVQRRLAPAAIDLAYGRTVEEHLGPDESIAPMVESVATPPPSAAQAASSTAKGTPPTKQPGARSAPAAPAAGPMQTFTLTESSPAEQASRQSRNRAVGLAVAIGLVAVALGLLRPWDRGDVPVPPEGDMVVTQVDDGIEDPPEVSTAPPSDVELPTFILEGELDEDPPEDDASADADADADADPSPDADADPDPDESASETKSTASSKASSSSKSSSTKSSSTKSSSTKSSTSSAEPPASSSKTARANKTPSTSGSASTDKASSSSQSSSSTGSSSDAATASTADASTGTGSADDASSSEASTTGTPVATGPRILGSTSSSRTGLVDLSKAGTRVWLVGPRGREKSGTLPIGTYTIRAVFGDNEVSAGSFTLGMGESVLVKCSQATLRCRAEEAE